jgi:hypothetical protein
LSIQRSWKQIWGEATSFASERFSSRTSPSESETRAIVWGRDLGPSLARRAVRGRHLPQRRFESAERDRRVGEELLPDPEPVRRLDHVLQTHHPGHLDGRDVDRVLEGAADRDDPGIVVVVVVRLVGRLAGIDHDRDGSVEEGVRRGVPVFERRQIDEGLEGRPGLAVRLHRAVELRLVPVVAADHGPHRPGRVLEDQHRPLGPRQRIGDGHALPARVLFDRHGDQVPRRRFDGNAAGPVQAKAEGRRGSLRPPIRTTA